MNIRKSDLSRTILFVFVCTFVFGFTAHAYRFFSTAFSHDSTYLYQDMAAWQISIGRFLQPVYLLLRGKLCVPFLIGLFSLLWLSAGISLLVALLDVKSRVAIALICGILSTNAVLSVSFATYLPWCDIYTLSFLLSVFSVYIMRRFKFGFLIGAIPLAAVLALYQSYLETAVFLCLALLIKDCFENLAPKQVILRALKALCLLAVGLVLYYICLKIVLSASQIGLTTAANGITGVGDYSKTSIPHMMIKTYLYPFEYYLHPTTFHPLAAVVLNIIVMLLLVFLFVKVSVMRKLSWQNRLFALLLFLAIPFGMNVVYFISKGFKHELMSYAFYLPFVFALSLQELSQPDLLGEKAGFASRWTVLRRYASKGLLAFCIGLLICNNIIFANHLYLKKQLEYETTIATLTRVVDRMEQTDGYVVGQTPVALIGSLNDSQVIADRPGYDTLEALGTGSRFSVTYLATYRQFFQNILCYPVNLIQDEQQLEALSAREQVLSMPSFPSNGCCIMLDGILILKLS